MRNVATVVAALLCSLSACVLDEARGRPPSLLARMPTGIEVGPACVILAQLPTGDPLAGVSAGSRRQEAAIAAVAGEPVDLEGLESVFADLNVRIDLFTSTMRAAHDALSLEVPNPLDLAAGEWAAFQSHIEEQQRLTMLAMSALQAAPDGRSTSLSDAQRREYEELARAWHNAQRVVVFTGTQLEWSHDRAMQALAECGELPVFGVGVPDDY